MDDVLIWASDERVTRFVHWNGAKNKEELVKFMDETVRHHPWFRAICLDNRAVGGISVELHSSEDDKCRGKLGFLLSVEQWGKGIMREAVRMATKEVFCDVGGLERIEALVDEENKASQRVLEKVGFVREGMLRKYKKLRGRVQDVALYSLLKSDQVSVSL